MSGDRANETARLEDLSESFQVDAFLLTESKKAGERAEALRFWFGGDGPSVHLLPVPRGRLGGGYLFKLCAGVLVSAALALRRLRRGVDAVVTRDPVMSLPVLAVSRVLRIRTVYNIPIIPFTYKHTRARGTALANPPAIGLAKAIDFGCLCLCDWIAVASPAASDEIRDGGLPALERKVVVLPFPIPGCFFDRSPRTVGEPGTKVLEYLGTVYRSQDFAPLVDAVRRLAGAGDGIELRVRDTNPRAHWKRKLAGKDPRDPVSFVEARIPRRDVPSVLSEATALVVPIADWVRVNVPVKAMEAMAMGVPVVVSNPTDPHIFRDGATCIVVRENTSQAWQEALLRLNDEETLRRVALGGRAMAEGCRPGQNARILLDLLEGRRARAAYAGGTVGGEVV